MTNLHKLLKSSNFSTEVDAGKLVNKAESIFEQKPYVIEHRAKYLTFNFLSIFLQVASAFMAFSFFNYIFYSLNYYINICFSIACVIAIEILKKVFLTSYFFEVRKGKKDNQMLFFAVFLITVSVVTSLQGAKFATMAALDNSEVILNESRLQIDSIKKTSESEILALQNEIDLINSFRKKRWKGVLVKEEQQQIEALNQRIILEEERQKNELKELKENSKGMANESQKNAEGNSYYVLALSLSFEVLQIFCIWWISGFLHLVYLENNLETANVETANVSTASVGTANVGTASVPTANVGFRVSYSDQKVCQNCGKDFKYKIHNQKFCNENCRIENWEKKTGKTFKHSKKI